MTISGIIKQGAHPRAERMAKLLAAVPHDTARELLTAYLLDDCPTDWVDRVTILVEASDTSDSKLQEPTTSYRVQLSTAGLARQILAQMSAALDAGDTLLADWLATTGRLLVSPHLSPRADPDEG